MRRRSPLRELLPALGAGLTLAELGALAGGDDERLKQRLAQAAHDLQGSASRLSDAIGQRYFAHADGGDGLQRV